MFKWPRIATLSSKRSKALGDLPSFLPNSMSVPNTLYFLLHTAFLDNILKTSAIGAFFETYVNKQSVFPHIGSYYTFWHFKILTMAAIVIYTFENSYYRFII